MKKLLLMMLLVLLGAGIVVVHSCRKDDNGKNDNDKTGNNLIPKTDAEIEQKIKVFKQQYEFLVRNPGLKNSSLLQYDDALWLMEASLNYTYAHPAEVAQSMKIDSCFISIPKIGDDSVVFQDVALCYGKFIDSLSKMYYLTDWSDKYVLLGDISLFDITNSDKFTLKLSVVIGKAMQEIIPFGNPFDETDYWFYAGCQGKCGPYFPSGFGSDASKEIAQYQQWFLPQYQVPPACHFYYTDVENIYINGNDFPNPADGIPNDNQLDYLLFYQDPALPNYHECLDPSEMWFYLQGLYQVATDNDKARAHTTPPLKDFMCLELNAGADNLLRIFHRPKIKYGFRHLSTDQMMPLNIPQ